jgi:predicted dehydrogenase
VKEYSMILDGRRKIWDVGCYPLATRASQAEPPEVFGWQVTGPTGTDDTFIGQLRFDHDVYVQFDCSFIMPYHVFMEFIGSEGTLIVPDPYKPYTNVKIYLTRGDKTETLKIKGEETYLGEVEDMADAILLGRDPRISLADSRANVAIILAA